MFQSQSSVSPALARVARGNLCAGCGGCALVAPGAVEMQMQSPGFLRPVQTGPVLSDIEATIAAICPGLGQTVESAGRQDHILWGPFVEMRTGWSTDPALRHRASSGGALSALVIQLLESRAVEGVIQTREGVPPVANATVLSRTSEQVSEAAGSRYAPSAPLAGLGAYLEGDGAYVFIGKPCDVAALRALAKRDARVDKRFPYMISFFCAGVPSQAGAEAILAALGTNPEETVAFRYRGMGWPGRATAVLQDGSERSMSYAESWGRILSGQVQHRCKICADGTGVAADIVCADAWEADAEGYPVFNEAPGISLIVARTETGRTLMEVAEAAGHLETRPFDPADLEKIQPGQTRRRQAILARLLALRLIGWPAPRYVGLRLRDAARRNDARSNVRNFLGAIRRALRRPR